MGEDYPRNLLEFEERFGSEEACRAYVMALRWPAGFICPRCGGHQAWMTKRHLLVCVPCEYQVSLTAGTIFQDTRKPLRLWFRAMWWLTTQKNGASALGLQRELGLGAYWTAWTWLHKLRRAMVRPGRDRLAGTVEVDETYWGGREEGVVGRLTHEKALIMIAAQQDGKGIGRIRLGRIPDLTQKRVHGFIAQAVEPGSVVITDGLNIYGGLKGYEHRPIVLKRQGPDASTWLPCVHRVASLLKRWLMGTHQGAVRPEHLDYYLDEFTFRFNRRTSASRGKLFYRLMQQAVQTEPVPYKDLVKHISPGPNHKQ
ncbi:MAG: IS1595 family transposase [Planctomycetes bacterium]|nr:IS1595 family transposase [Planctomycetota bacterium]